MKTHALKALSKRRAAGAKTGGSGIRFPAHDPLGFICERHRDNPFVRLLRAAFFYDDRDRVLVARDRVPGAGEEALRGPWRSRLKY